MGGRWANQQGGVVTEFGEDPNGRATARNLLTEIWFRVQGTRTHPYAPENGDPSITFNGLGPPPQTFKGMATGLGGATPYRNGGSATIASGLVEGPLGDPARRIFASRMRRRSGLGSM
jgi:hypothetical protein